MVTIFIRKFLNSPKTSSVHKEHLIHALASTRGSFHIPVCPRKQQLFQQPAPAQSKNHSKGEMQLAARNPTGFLHQFSVSVLLYFRYSIPVFDIKICVSLTAQRVSSLGTAWASSTILYLSISFYIFLHFLLLSFLLICSLCICL